jgi:hypothetical protein
MLVATRLKNLVKSQTPIPRMKLRLAGTVKRLNVEHRTSNIEHRILMTLRFIYFKTSEPQNFEGRFARTAPALVPRVAQSFF